MKNRCACGEKLEHLTGAQPKLIGRIFEKEDIDKRIPGLPTQNGKTAIPNMQRKQMQQNMQTNRTNITR